MADESQSLSELFQLAPEDYSLTMLQKVFGGVIDFVNGGEASALQDGSLLSTAMGYINIIVLGIATLIGAFTVLSLTADTASDGQALGRSTDTKYTFLRAGMAGALLLPVKGGFSLIQLIAFYLMIWGPGVADATWKGFVDFTLDGEAVLGPQELSSSDQWRLRGDLADASYAMIRGYVCAFHLDRLAKLENIDGYSTNAMQNTTVTKPAPVGGLFEYTSRTETKTFEIYWKTQMAARNANDICGSVSYSTTYKINQKTDDFFTAEGKTLSDQLSLIARTTVHNSVRDTLLTYVLPESKKIAQEIFSGEGSGSRNMGAISEDIRRISTEAAKRVYNARLSDTELDDERMLELRKSIEQSVTQQGWVLAALWQRGLSEIYVQLAEYRNSISLRVDDNTRIFSIFGSGASGWMFSDNAVSRASFEPVERDFDFLDEFEPVVSGMKNPTTEEETEIKTADGAKKRGGEMIGWVYNTALGMMSVSNSDGVYQDPFIRYASIGQEMTTIGAITVGGAKAINAAAVAVGGSRGDAVKLVTDPLSIVGKYILILGIVFTLITWIPMLYYFSAVLGWLALCIESVFALPIALLLWFAPAREPSMIGPWQKTVLTLFGLLLRPFFTVIGLIACVICLWIGNELLAVIFGAVLMVMPTPTWNPVSVVGILGSLGVFAYATYALAMHTSSFITKMGDSALGWIGAQMTPLSQDSTAERFDGQARMTVDPMAGRGAGGFVDSYAQGAGNRIGTFGGVVGRRYLTGPSSKGTR